MAILLRQLLQAGSDPKDGSITLLLGDGDQSAVRFDIHHSLVAGITAVLAAEHRDLMNRLPPEQASEGATINCDAVRLSQDLDGHPMLVFELRGGALLPLVFQEDDLSGLAAEMALLAAKPEGRG